MDDLEKALGKYHPDKPPTHEMLRMAVMNAAHEAGANFCRSEELVAALHALVAIAGRPQEISETLLRDPQTPRSRAVLRSARERGLETARLSVSSGS